MSFNDILKLKKQKEDQHKTSTQYFKSLVVGKDLFAMKVYHELSKLSQNVADSSENRGSLAFLAPDKIESLRDLQWRGPSRARGQNTEALKELYPELAADTNEVTSIFFKDGKFHPFGSRAKSSPLLEGEDYFKQNTIRVNENEIYPELGEEEVLDKMFDSITNCPIVSISYEANPTDLVEPVFWKVNLSDGKVIQTSHLYWGLHPFRLMDLMSGKESLDRKVIENFQALRTKSQLSVEYQLSSTNFDEIDKTWFLPLSQTHDWGHFIGDFFVEGDHAVGRFIHFLDEKEVNEEDVAKKLRILKRNFEKILDDKKQIIGDEYVRFEEYSDCQNINDETFKETPTPFKNLYMFGNNAPLGLQNQESFSFEDSLVVPTHLVRGLLTTRAVLESGMQ